MKKRSGAVQRDVRSVDAGRAKMDGPGVESLKSGMRFRRSRGEDDGMTFESERVEEARGNRTAEIRRLRAKVNRRVWLGVVVLGLVLVAVGSLWFLRWRHRDRTAVDGGVIGVADHEIFDAGSAEDWQGALPIEVAEAFTEAEAAGDRLKWVRDPLRVGLALGEFFRDGPGATEKVAELNRMGPVQTATLSFVRFHVRMEDGTNRLLCVVVTEEGARVDFECYARLGSESWADLLTGKAEEAVEVRVFVEAGSYYNHGFADDGKWRHFVATTPDVNLPLDFYAARGSEAERMLAGIAGGGAMRATLAIRSVKGSFEERQFEVTRVLGPGWVVERPTSNVQR